MQPRIEETIHLNVLWSAFNENYHWDWRRNRISVFNVWSAISAKLESFSTPIIEAIAVAAMCHKVLRVPNAIEWTKTTKEKERKKTAYSFRFSNRIVAVQLNGRFYTIARSIVFGWLLPGEFLWRNLPNNINNNTLWCIIKRDYDEHIKWGSNPGIILTSREKERKWASQRNEL